jgi:DNA-binding NtrC family response regulator
VTAGAELGLRVLVVDDEPAICQALTLLLACHGIQVSSALSAAEAKAKLAASRFDVLLIDLRLRDARGDMLLRELAQDEPSLKERTLFITGDISTEAERLITATNCPYLRKPFDITLAVQAIAARAGKAYPPAARPIGDGESKRELR